MPPKSDIEPQPWRLGHSIQTKFGRDIAWNLASFGVLGVCGVLINILLAKVWGSATLGVFNQVLTLYIVLSQICVFGVHFSVLKHVPEQLVYGRDCSCLISAAIAISVVLATLFTTPCFFLTGTIANLFDSAEVGAGFGDIVPAIWLFALNKVLINVLNGFRAMRAFAIAQAARPILILAGLVLFAALRLPGERTVLAVTLAEGLLFMALLQGSLRFFAVRFGGESRDWVVRHLRFGWRSFLSGSLGEINSRVDVIILGVFVSDRLVGIYSMASMLVEGLAQLAAVLKNNLNPIIAHCAAVRDWERLTIIVRSAVRGFYMVMFVAGLIGIAAFPVVIKTLVGSVEFTESWAIFSVLTTGLVVCAGYLPLDLFLVQCGYPSAQTVWKALVLTTNVALNLIFIPVFGTLGAAAATASGFCISALYLKWMSGRLLPIRI